MNEFWLNFLKSDQNVQSILFLFVFLLRKFTAFV